MSILFFLSVAALAFANGANDNFKGVATLWGSGDLTYRQAWWIANGATLLGALMAVVLGFLVANTFSGKGVVTPEVLKSSSFAMAFATGAAATVLLATWLKYPISTTHAILGSLAGAGLALAANDVNLQPLIESGVIPLLLSPALAAVATFTLWKIATMLLAKGNPAISLQPFRKPVHFISGFAVCFSRAVNDTPKIASIALLGIAADVPDFMVYATVGIFMTIGGMIFCRRIADIMSQKITGMNAPEGLTGNLVTAFLVIFASKLGLAVSTTHISVGALFGLGMATGKGHLKKVFEIFLSWVLTLPIAFGLAFAIAKLLTVV